MDTRITTGPRARIRAMSQEPVTPEPVRSSETGSELEAIQEKLRRLAEQLAAREKVHDIGSSERDDEHDAPV
jgi:type IV secretory pathway ATPase VirB11/archaellum biosynthesis ATPase